MRGYRNLSIIMVAIATSTFLVWAGIQYGTDMVGLATVIGAKDASVAAAIFGRAWNKKAEALNGGTQ